MVNFQKVLILLAIVIGMSSTSSAEVFGQFGGGGLSTTSQDASVTLTKSRLTERSLTTTGSVRRFSNPNLYRNRGYVAATVNSPTQLAFFLWIRHDGLEDSEDHILAEEYHGTNLGTVVRIKINSEELSETIILVRRKQAESQARLVVRGISLNATEPVYLHLDLTKKQPKLRRISPTWGNFKQQLIRHEGLAELFATIDELQDGGMLVLEEITSEMDGDTQFAEQVKREFEGFFE